MPNLVNYNAVNVPEEFLPNFLKGSGSPSTKRVYLQSC